MTPEIFERVAAWVGSLPRVSDRIDALHLAFENAAEWSARSRRAGDDDGAHAHESAAIGILLALVRVAWGNPRAHIADYDGSAWAVHAGGSMWVRATEAEALVAALENAPADGGGR